MSRSQWGKYAGQLCLAAWTVFGVQELRADLFVSSQTAPAADSVLRYSSVDGTFLGTFVSNGGLRDPLGMTFGPDGNLYVASGNSDEVRRYDGASGAFLGVFASGGGLRAPVSLTFGPDGNLYVSSSCCQVLRFHGATGAFMDVFATGGELDYPRGLKFGPDGDLYVVSYNTASVLRYDGATGAFAGAFVTSGSGGLGTPSDLAFGPDGNLYVTGGPGDNPGVFRYHGITGEFINQFASVGGAAYPLGMAFGPDANLYVVTGGATFAVSRFDWKTGAFIDHFVQPDSGGLGNPFGVAFSPYAATRVDCPGPVTVQCGQSAEVTVGVVSPDGGELTLIWTVNGNVMATNTVPASQPPTRTNVTFRAELPLGTNVVGVVAMSSPTNAAFCSTSVAVVDTTPPNLRRTAAIPSQLWPPNHRLVPVRIYVRASDGCGPVTCRIKSVKSNEPADRRGRRDRSPDWIITGDLTLKLRAERTGTRGDRVYTITVECKDAAGNTSTSDTTVRVPHDQGRGHDDDRDKEHGDDAGTGRGDDRRR